MSINEITNMMDNIKFTEEENDILDDVGLKPESSEGSKKWMVGKLFNTKPIVTEAVTRVFRKVFTENKLEEIFRKVFTENKLTGRDFQKEGKKDTLNRISWVFDFDDDYFSMQDLKPELSITEYRFEKFHIWVRVFGILLGMMSKQIGGRMGNMMGTFVAIDMREGDGRWESS
ncbi:hypothetical protein V6N13_089034 [Hibiscus sabdariffa]